MATKNRAKFEVIKTAARARVIFCGSITLGSSGAIASTSGDLPTTTTAGAFGIIKTAAKTGRYSLKFDKKYKEMRVLGVDIFGPNDTAFGNTNANAVATRNAALDGFDIQLMLASTGVDTDGASGYRIDWSVIAKEY